MAFEPEAGSKSIAEMQDLEENLRLLAAANGLYSRAKRIQLFGSTLSILLAFLAVILLYVSQTAGTWLGAVAGGWILLSRLVFQPWRDRKKLEGARAQEAFDCGVFNLNWNLSLAKRLSLEEIRNASKNKDIETFRAWYPQEITRSWPNSVLICQRSNAVWARRQNSLYAIFLALMTLVMAAAGMALCLHRGEMLSIYLVAVFLPSLPSLLDFLDLARSHFREAKDREALEERIDGQLSNSSAVSAESLRQNQDGIFLLRSKAPLVPGWFYKRLASGFEKDMRFASDQLSRRIED